MEPERAGKISSMDKSNRARASRLTRSLRVQVIFWFKSLQNTADYLQHCNASLTDDQSDEQEDDLGKLLFEKKSMQLGLPVWGGGGVGRWDCKCCLDGLSRVFSTTGNFLFKSGGVGRTLARMVFCIFYLNSAISNTSKQGYKPWKSVHQKGNYRLRCPLGRFFQLKNVQK